MVVKSELVVRADANPGERLVVVSGLVERMRSVPGVAGIAPSENGFSSTDSGTQALQIRGFQAAARTDTSSSFDQVGPDYFKVIGIPLLGGREFDETDRAGAPPVAIVNETMADFYSGNAARSASPFRTAASATASWES